MDSTLRLLCLQGVAIEVLQYWGGFRFGDWEDAVADAVGVFLGLIVFKLCMRMYIKSNMGWLAKQIALSALVW